MKNDFNPYEVLGVKSNATPETIKKKYRALCFRTHQKKKKYLALMSLDT